MPVTKLWVEGELDEQILSKILAGAPVVQRGGSKYGLRRVVLQDREKADDNGAHFLRDRDFDFEPTPSSPPSPTPMTGGPGRLVLGWRWQRHSLESYLLEPSLAAIALGKGREEVEKLIRQAGRELVNYEAARWAVGQARSTLPPSRLLKTAPDDLPDEFGLPDDRSETASWEWISAATNKFILPVAEAFKADSLRPSFDNCRGKLAQLDVDGILIWFSGKDILAFISPLLGEESPKVIRNRLRNWVRENPEQAVELLPEWAELKRILAA